MRRRGRPEQYPYIPVAPQRRHQTLRNNRPRGEQAGLGGPAEAAGHAGSGHLRRARRSASELAQDSRRRTTRAGQTGGSGRRRNAVRPWPATAKLRGPERQAPVSALRQTESAATLRMTCQKRAPAWRIGGTAVFSACADSVACAGTIPTRVAVPHSVRRAARAPAAGRPPTRTARATRRAVRRAVLCHPGLPRRGGRVVLAWISAPYAVCAGIRSGRTGKPSEIRRAHPPPHVRGRPSQLKFWPAESADERHGGRFGRNEAPEWQFVITFIIVYLPCS